MANHVLGGGMSSRLFQEVREERGLAYSVYSSVVLYVDCGALAVYAGTAPAKVPEVLEPSPSASSPSWSTTASPTRSTRSPSATSRARCARPEDTGSRMARLGRSEQVRGEVITLDEHLAALRAVTLDDVARVLRRVLGGPRTLVAVGPFDDLPG